ncbi:MAG: YwaF family protein [Clostridia bacterium]|nr:YwaF family protein [Clostridia bacterium]
MEIINSIMKFLDAEMKTPTAYGWFHLLMFALVIGFTVFLCVKFKNSTEKQNKIILLTLGFICIGFEIYKQLNFSYNGGNWTYQWYAFPFQFCSTPMYVAIIAGFLKPSKFRDCLYSFLATFGLFAGLAVMFYPGDVFISTIGINIQTMVHHGLQITFGVYLIVSKRVELKPKTILKAAPVFMALVLIALSMNCITHFAGLTDTFNMFYISPWYNCHLPILSLVYANTPYIVFLLVYILGFTLCGFIVLMAALGINKLYILISNKIKNRKQADSQNQEKLENNNNEEKIE